MAAFSEGNLNFFRLYYVLNDFGTKALNEVLRHVVYRTFPPAMTLRDLLALPQVQRELCPSTTRRSCLDPMQRELLYPSGIASTTLDYGDLDITLVTTLLKNLTVFSRILSQPGSCPMTLWTNPTERDQLFYPIEANFVLLRNKRNAMAHSRKPSVLAEEFQAAFNQVKNLVMNIMRLVGPAATFNEVDIEQYRTSPLLPDVFREAAAKLLQSLQAAEYCNEELKDEVQKLVEKQAKMEERLVGQIVRLSKKTRYRIIGCLFIAAVVIFVMLVWTKVSADHKFQEETQSRLELEKELEEVKEFSEAKRTDGIGLAKIQLRREKPEDLEIRKQKLRHAIKMHPDICSSWENEVMKEKQIEDCIDRLLRNVRGSSFRTAARFTQPLSTKDEELSSSLVKSRHKEPEMRYKLKFDKLIKAPGGTIVLTTYRLNQKTFKRHKENKLQDEL